MANQQPFTPDQAQQWAKSRKIFLIKGFILGGIPVSFAVICLSIYGQALLNYVFVAIALSFVIELVTIQKFKLNESKYKEYLKAK